MQQFQREIVQQNDILGFGGQDNYVQEPLINYFYNKQTKQVSQPRKLVNYIDATKQKRKNSIKKQQRIRPVTAQNDVVIDKPQWDGHQVVKTDLFDKGIAKNELFRNDRQIKMKNVQFEKENMNNTQKQIDKQEQNKQTFRTLNEIEHGIIKQRDIKSEFQLKKQQKELNQLQWMVQQEKQLKLEQDKEFKDNFNMLQQNKVKTNIKVNKGSANKPRRSTSGQNGQNQSPYQKKSTPKRTGAKKQLKVHDEGEFNDEYSENSQIDTEVWKNTLDIIEYQETKGNRQELLPGQYSDLDQVPSRGRNPQSQEKAKQVGFKQLMPILSNQDNELLRQQLLEISKRELQRQVELDLLIKKQEQHAQSDPKLSTQQYNHLTKKMAQIKNAIAPIIRKMDLPESKTQYPFTGHLLARTISKLIQSHSEQLGELIIDEILVEMVGHLNEVEEKKQSVKYQQKQKDTLNDFIEAFKDLAYDQDQIEARRMQRPQTKPEQQPQQNNDPKYLPLMQLERDQDFFKNSDDRVRYVETSSGFIMKVLENRKKRVNQTRKTSMYAPKNVEVFNKVCKDIMDNLLDDAARHMEKYTDQLAEQIFVNEFK